MTSLYVYSENLTKMFFSDDTISMFGYLVQFQASPLHYTVFTPIPTYKTMNEIEITVMIT